MSVTEQLLAALVLYGLPVLFGVILIASVGLPLPVSFILVAAGSFAKQGDMKLVPVIIAASCAAILGDQIGYGVSRWGGRRLINRITNRIGGASKIKKAEALSKKWGGPGIFFSRWLVTELGPWINVTSGITGYPWRRFLLWGVSGEILWVGLYVGLGYTFSDRVQYLAEILGNLAWVILGLVVTLLLGWKVLRYFRPARKSEEDDEPSELEPAPSEI
ncbi:MAG TPA: DedA family protein [Pyrinomonadaceae bacterium]|nr:DedA family protein [Pyrinomonadaceae bacterium]